MLAIPARAAALRGVRVYVGDGATIARPIVRRRGARRFGHASVREQLAWCRAEGVPAAIFTHCGSQIVASDAARSARRIAGLGRAMGVEACVADDGTARAFRARARQRSVARG